MRFLWIDIDDEPGPASIRGFIERNSIALLSNHGRPNLANQHPGCGRDPVKRFRQLG
jgi:hypothetical protein